MFLYVVFDEIDKKNWIFFEADNDRAAKRIMRQNILKYQKDIDFEYSLKKLIEVPQTSNYPVIVKSDELFKSDEKIEEEEI